jgi:hypothetical protein
MNKSQKIWLYFITIYSSLHLIRDILQDLHIKTILSTVLVKTPTKPIASTILWTSLNTYIIAILEIVLALYCLKRDKFGKAGYTTIVIAVVTVIAWLIYWFFL